MLRRGRTGVVDDGELGVRAVLGRLGQRAVGRVDTGVDEAHRDDRVVAALQSSFNRAYLSFSVSFAAAGSSLASMLRSVLAFPDPLRQRR